MTRGDELPQRFVRLAAAIRVEVTQLVRVTAEAELAPRAHEPKTRTDVAPCSRATRKTSLAGRLRIATG